MSTKSITFDQVFNIWLDTEANQLEGRDILSLAKQKGFNSVAEWRLTTALRLGLDTKQWHLEEVADPNETLPKIIIGPYQGWSKFLDNKLATSFEEALQIPEFLEWCKTHDRIIPLSQKFPLPTTLIVLRKLNGDVMHVEGGHRVCAVAFAKAIGQPIDFTAKPPITLAIANFADEDQDKFLQFLKVGAHKQ